MENISLNQETLELNSNIKYIVIDALYLNDIKQAVGSLNFNNILEDIRAKVFPYTDTPFAEYAPIESIFSLDKIKKVEYDEIDVKAHNVLSTDTGVIVFINEKLLVEFALKFDYGELVNSSFELLNTKYWKSLVGKYNLVDVAIVASPGIAAGREFDGGGTYMVI